MNTLFGRMKALLGGTPSSQAGMGVRPSHQARARPRGAVGARVKLRTAATDLRVQLEAERHASASPVEQNCPSCGAPMLAGWGASCGSCKPKFSSPKTILLAAGDVAGLLSMTLGWLVVLRTPDAPKEKSLIELTDPVVTLTRAGSPPQPGSKAIELSDEYMSVGHAVIRRPMGISRDAAFTLEDRKTPGPSANGTFIRGRRLERGEVASVANGDIIRVGTTELYFASLWLPASSV